MPALLFLSQSSISQMILSKKATMRNLITIVIATCMLACNNTNKPEDLLTQTTTAQIPENAIPMVYDDYIYIQGSIDSVQTNLTIDLGTDRCCIDSLFHEEFLKSKYKHYEHTCWFDKNGTEQFESYVKDSILLKTSDYDCRISNVPIINLKPRCGDFLNVLLGTEFFKDDVIEINYADRYLCIHKDIKQLNLSEFDCIKYKFIDNFICIPVEVNINDTKKIKGNFILDTGCPSSTISGLLFKRSELTEVKSKISYYTEFGPFGEYSSGFDLIANSLRLSKYTFSNCIISVNLDNNELLDSGDFAGVIGNDVLSRFDCVIDFGNQVLYLKPNRNFGAPFMFENLGFLYIDRIESQGGLVVTGLYENSEGETNQLMIGDIITSVNGLPVTSGSSLDENTSLFTMAVLRLTVIRNGKTINIKHIRRNYQKI
jgi:hypothetical protein